MRGLVVAVCVAGCSIPLDSTPTTRWPIRWVDGGMHGHGWYEKAGVRLSASTCGDAHERAVYGVHDAEAAMAECSRWWPAAAISGGAATAAIGGYFAAGWIRDDDTRRDVRMADIAVGLTAFVIGLAFEYRSERALHRAVRLYNDALDDQ